MSSDTPENAGTFENLKRQFTRTLEALSGSDLGVRPYRPSVDGILGTPDVPAGHEEVERYWVNAPYAYALVTYDPEENEHQYRAVEPDTDGFERRLLRRVINDIRDPLLYRTDGTSPATESVLMEELQTLLEQYGVDVRMNTFHTLLYYLQRDFRGFGKIDPLTHDDHIEDISCDGYDLPIFVYHDQYTDIETNIQFGAEELDNYVIRLAQQSGRHISVGDPVIGTTLPDGSRAELALGEEVTPRGSAFTIRMYADEPFTPIDLIEYGTFSVEEMAFLWLCIENNKSLIFAGGTASGKTTSMNAVSKYIIVGEVRGEEAVTLFQAMNTGHTTFSTMHADSIETVINRLENEPINVPRPMVQSLDLLCIQTLTRLEGKRVRRSKAIGEIGGIDQRTGELDYSNAFQWVADTDSFERNDSTLLDEIQTERGWSRSRLLSELRDRERFLRFLRDRGISDYRQFTALINEYYAHPEEVMERLAAEAEISPEAGYGAEAE